MRGPGNGGNKLALHGFLPVAGHSPSGKKKNMTCHKRVQVSGEENCDTANEKFQRGITGNRASGTFM